MPITVKYGSRYLWGVGQVPCISLADDDAEKFATIHPRISDVYGENGMWFLERGISTSWSVPSNDSSNPSCDQPATPIEHVDGKSIDDIVEAIRALPVPCSEGACVSCNDGPYKPTTESPAVAVCEFICTVLDKLEEFGLANVDEIKAQVTDLTLPKEI